MKEKPLSEELVLIEGTKEWDKIAEAVARLKEWNMPSYTLMKKKLVKVGNQGEMVRKDDLLKEINSIFGDFKTFNKEDEDTSKGCGKEFYDEK